MMRKSKFTIFSRLLLAMSLPFVLGFGCQWHTYNCGSIKGVPGQFVLMERQIHPIPSEYERKLLWKNGEEIREFKLIDDTGGMSELEFELLEIRSAKYGTLKTLRSSEGTDIELGRFPEEISLTEPKRIRSKVGEYKRGSNKPCSFF